MKTYLVTVNSKKWEIKASSTRVAINKILRSIVGTRTADKQIPLYITVNTPSSVASHKEKYGNSK